MSDKISGYTSEAGISNLDLFDFSKHNGIDGYDLPNGGTRSLSWENLKNQLINDLGLTNYYDEDGQLSSNRTVEMKSNWSKWDDGQILFGDISAPDSRLHVVSEIGENALRISTFSVTDSLVVNNVGNIGIGNGGDVTASGANDSKLRVVSANNGGTGMAVQVSGFNTGASVGINTLVNGGAASADNTGGLFSVNGGQHNRGVRGEALLNATGYNIGIQGNARNGVQLSVGGYFLAGAGAGQASGEVIGSWAQVQGNPNTKKTAFKATFGDNTNSSVNTGFHCALNLNGTSSQNIGLDLNIQNGSALNAAIYIRNGDFYILNLANTGVANRVWNNGTDNLLRWGV